MNKLKTLIATVFFVSVSSMSIAQETLVEDATNDPTLSEQRVSDIESGRADRLQDLITNSRRAPNDNPLRLGGGFDMEDPNANSPATSNNEKKSSGFDQTLAKKRVEGTATFSMVFMQWLEEKLRNMTLARVRDDEYLDYLNDLERMNREAEDRSVQAAIEGETSARINALYSLRQQMHGELDAIGNQSRGYAYSQASQTECIGNFNISSTGYFTAPSFSYSGTYEKNSGISSYGPFGYGWSGNVDLYDGGAQLSTTVCGDNAEVLCPDSFGSPLLICTGFNGISTKIISWYQQYLKRCPEQQGLTFYMNKYTGDDNLIEQEIKNSPEARRASIGNYHDHDVACTNLGKSIYGCSTETFQHDVSSASNVCVRGPIRPDTGTPPGEDIPIETSSDSLELCPGKPYIVFEPMEYLAANPDVTGGATGAYNHYIQTGHAQGRAINTLGTVWDEATYFIYNPDVEESVQTQPHYSSGFDHWSKAGRYEGRTISQNCNATEQCTVAFNTTSYSAAHPDLQQTFGPQTFQYLNHFRTYGLSEGRAMNLEGHVFSDATYLELNPDVAAQVSAGQTTARQHFKDVGIYESRPVARLSNSAQCSAGITTSSNGVCPAQTLSWGPNSLCQGEAQQSTVGDRAVFGIANAVFDGTANFLCNESGWFLEPGATCVPAGDVCAGQGLQTINVPDSALVGNTFIGSVTGKPGEQVLINEYYPNGSLIQTFNLTLDQSGQTQSSYVHTGTGTSGNTGTFRYMATFQCGGVVKEDSIVINANPLSGVCGTANNTTITTAPAANAERCIQGTSTPPQESATGWSWACQGESGGLNASCSAIKPSSCASKMVSWFGNYSCTGLAPSGVSGQVVTVTDSEFGVDGSVGSLKFRCTNGDWVADEFQLPQTCEIPSGE